MINCTDKSIEEYTEYIPNFVDPSKDEVLFSGIKADLQQINFNHKAANKQKIQTQWFGQSFRKKTTEFPFDNKEVVNCTPFTEVPFIKQLVEKVNGDKPCGSEQVSLVSYQISKFFAT